MKPQTIVYDAHDGERLTFQVPKGVSRALVARCIRRIHEGASADLAVRGLTDSEHGLVLDIVASLEEHRVPVAS